MFFFESITWEAALVWFLVLAILVLLNEVVRMSKLTSILMFMVLPVVLTVVWLTREKNDLTSWFHWIKVYSALAGSLIFMVIRFTDYHKKHRWFLLLVPGILGINIMEAVVREFQVGFLGFSGIVDGMNYISGGWNYANALAGLINLLMMCGWFGIRASKKGKRVDMVWPDLTLLFIISYGLWNISYVYSCAPGNAFYSGLALNIAPVITTLLVRGTWLQNRAHTLTFWMMWVMTFPYFFAQGSAYNVSVSYNPTANWIIAILSLGFNLILLISQIRRIMKFHLNPLKDEIWEQGSLTTSNSKIS
jgi:hypothetical protein